MLHVRVCAYVFVVLAYRRRGGCEHGGRHHHLPHTAIFGHVLARVGEAGRHRLGGATSGHVCRQQVTNAQNLKSGKSPFTKIGNTQDSIVNGKRNGTDTRRIPLSQPRSAVGLLACLSYSGHCQSLFERSITCSAVSPTNDAGSSAIERKKRNQL